MGDQLRVGDQCFIAQTIEAQTDKIAVQNAERVVAANEAEIQKKKANKRIEVLKRNRELV